MKVFGVCIPQKKQNMYYMNFIIDYGVNVR